MEKKKHWRVSSITKKGIRHEKMNLRCQDYVVSGIYGKYQAIALADGAGNSDMAYYGAQKVSKTVVELLIKNFEELYKMGIEKIRYNIIVNIREELYKLCREEQVRLDDVKSTLLAAAVDTENQRCIMVHLGDGYIGTKTGNACRIISYPMNGMKRSMTYLTTTFPVASKIQVRCGQMESMDAIFLMSDGWCEKNKTIADIHRVYEQYERGQAAVDDYMDDVSMIAMSK